MQMNRDGDTAVTGDKSTVFYDYNRNTSISVNILDTVKSVKTYPSSKTSDNGAGLAAETYTFYDGNNADGQLSTAPTKGEPTRVKSATTVGSTYVSAYATYDTYGNRLTAQDANGNTTTWTYNSTYHSLPVTETYPAIGGSSMSESATMERSPNGTLADLLRSVTRLPIIKAVEASLQIAAALSHTQSLRPPVVHRDVKPTNVLVFSDDEVLTTKLADYGLAAAIEPETRLCRSGGALAFAAPEMVWGIGDERTDVYRLGVTLYRMLTGVHPYPIESNENVSATREFAAALSRGRRAIVPPSRYLMQRAYDLDDVVMKALEFDMFSRFRNAREFYAGLNEIKQRLDTKR